jgi:hypothetical protein
MYPEPVRPKAAAEKVDLSWSRPPCCRRIAVRKMLSMCVSLVAGGGGGGACGKSVKLKFGDKKGTYEAVEEKTIVECQTCVVERQYFTTVIRCTDHSLSNALVLMFSS